MANKNNHPNVLSKARIRFFEVDLEGDDASIQDAIKTCHAALTRPRGGNGVPVKVLAMGTGQVNTENVAPDLHVDHDEDGVDVELDTSDTERASEDSKPRGRPRSQYREPVWEILDIDIKTGKTPLEAFMKNAPDVIQRRCLMIVYWLKVHRGIEAVTPAHLLTCYRGLGWITPKSMRQPLEDLKRKKRWLDKGKGEHEFIINMPGISEVERMLTPS